MQTTKMLNSTEEFVSELITLDPFYEKSDDFKFWQRHRNKFKRLKAYALEHALEEDALKLHFVDHTFTDALRKETEDGPVSAIILHGLVDKHLDALRKQ